MFNADGYKMTDREVQLQNYVNGLDVVLEQEHIDITKKVLADADALREWANAQH